MSETVVYYRELLIREMKRSQAGLLAAIEDIQVRMVDLHRVVASGDRGVNEIGELQGAGPRLDVWCARYAAARRAIAEYDSIFGARAVRVDAMAAPEVARPSLPRPAGSSYPAGTRNPTDLEDAA